MAPTSLGIHLANLAVRRGKLFFYLADYLKESKDGSFCGSLFLQKVSCFSKPESIVKTVFPIQIGLFQTGIQFGIASAFVNPPSPIPLYPPSRHSKQMVVLGSTAV